MSDLCDICGRDAACELVSSGCAPVSYTACADCSHRHAENIDVAALWVHMRGGLGVQDAHLQNLVAWVDGSYVGWPEILAYYTKNKDAIVAGLSEDYELVDLPLAPEN